MKMIDQLGRIMSMISHVSFAFAKSKNSTRKEAYAKKYWTPQRRAQFSKKILNDHAVAWKKLADR